ncbi:hypothetical protein Adt_32996 [Abeliophyllum distichum]|uniref:Uncharacterized protein n=1 Tax=Abeliophyllum distichum TaxID=126358 RepID=A0ABD1QUZ9_9LAMI
MWTEVRRLGFIVTGHWATCHLIGTLPDEWQDVAEILYDLLWASVVPILPREIEYETFSTELTALWEETRDNTLEFSEAERVSSEMRICKDAPPPILDVEE